jgi:hypothetical protein
VIVDITSAHQGFMEWRLCPDLSRADELTCFTENLLQLANGEGSQVSVNRTGRFEVNLRLPTGLICDHCVIQWNYRAGAYKSSN